MEGLSFNNILSEESEINGLFSDSLGEEKKEEEQTEEKKEEQESSKETNDEQIPVTEVSVKDLFDEYPESVGNDNNNVDGITPSEEDGGKSPNNYYSSFAKALYEEGDIIPGVDEEFVKNANDAEGFKALIQEAVKAQLDEVQREYYNRATGMSEDDNQIAETLNIINNINSWSEDFLKSDSPEAIKIRRDILGFDFVCNRKYSEDKAQKLVDKAFHYGTDVEDAIEALNDVKEYYQNTYNNLLKNKEDKENQRKKIIKENSDIFINSIKKNNDFLGDLSIDEKTKDVIIDNYMNTKYKDKNGNPITAFQKYVIENNLEYQKNVAILFTLTDGFKNIDKLVNGKVNKEVKKGLKSLEKTLVNNSGFNDGNLAFVGNSGDGGITTGALPKGWHF